MGPEPPSDRAVALPRHRPGDLRAAGRGRRAERGRRSSAALPPSSSQARRRPAMPTRTAKTCWRPPARSTSSSSPRTREASPPTGARPRCSRHRRHERSSASTTARSSSRSSTSAARPRRPRPRSASRSRRSRRFSHRRAATARAGLDLWPLSPAPNRREYGLRPCSPTRPSQVDERGNSRFHGGRYRCGREDSNLQEPKPTGT